MRVYYDRDADVNLIKGRKVVVVGYGSQGHAHAMNLRDSGVADVVVALRPGSASAPKAEAAGFTVTSAAEAAKSADVVMVLTPDEHQGALWEDELKDNMREGTALAFAHGLNIHFNLIEPRADLDVFMIAPKGPGHTVRSEYQRGAGVPCLLAVEQDASGNAQEIGLSYGCAIGGGVVLVLSMVGCVSCVVWLDRPGDVIDPESLLAGDTTGYVEWTVDLADPGTDELLQSVMASLRAGNKAGCSPATALPPLTKRLRRRRPGGRRSRSRPLSGRRRRGRGSNR